MELDMRYCPHVLPTGLENYTLTITDLASGENEDAFLFRLIYSWRAIEHGPLYTQWIDLAEHRIEGFTEAAKADVVAGLLTPGTIYKMHHPFVIPARTTLRSCPGDLSLVILPSHLETEVYEDPTEPFFPVDGFSFATLDSIRRNHVPRRSSTDVIGRISGITTPIPSEAGGLNFIIALDHPSHTRLIIRYNSYVQRAPFTLADFARIERVTPVVCILTCLTLVRRPGETLVLRNTAASRILFAPFMEPFRQYFDMYSVIATCADATATTDIMFTGTSANMLFRMPVYEYALLDSVSENALMLTLHDRMFVIEMRSLGTSATRPAPFVATAIWDPVAAFF
ncbi:hypothetical protein LINGRAHAP2_LOCUS23355 [Linum grandiflorum]